LFPDIRKLGWKKFNGNIGIKVSPGLRRETIIPETPITESMNYKFISKGATLSTGEYISNWLTKTTSKTTIYD
jgi:hypothetical protein